MTKKNDFLQKLRIYIFSFLIGETCYSYVILYKSDIFNLLMFIVKFKNLHAMFISVVKKKKKNQCNVKTIS